MNDDTIPIAIVGLSCRLPGAATDPANLWRVCAEQQDVWQPMPRERMNHEAFYHPDPARNGTSNVRGGHFLQGSLAAFDSTFFSLTGTEAKAMDPQQRLLLELSYEALENAGVPLNKVAKSNTAVFIGSSCRDYADLLRRDNEKTELFQSTGVAQTMLSNRISYFYDLKGPSVAVDTACSSSLVALHLACNAIRAGESRMAIVGGSNLILIHEPMVDLSMLRFLSPDGRCYTYDERGNGFGRGEGAACLILKRYEDAVRDKDTIRAVIRNSGTNQDGRTAGISLPSGDAQVDLMRRTYEAVGLDPAETTYVEAHGTGTPAGDPIEAASLSKVFVQQKARDHPLIVGSVKSNIGHLEGGSGIAAVVKSVLMLEKGLLLPNFDFKVPSPRIPMDEWKIKVPTTVQSWPSEAIHRISVNNFGFGGSNAHVIIDDACEFASSRGAARKCQCGSSELSKTNGLQIGDMPSDSDESCHSMVFLLSAFDEATSRRQAHKLADFMREPQKHCPRTWLSNLAYTLAAHRSYFPWKVALAATSISSLTQRLATDVVKPTKASQAGGVVFVFTGQGAQWYAMGRELISVYPVFRHSLEMADLCLRGLGTWWSLLDELMKDHTTSLVNDTALSHPLTTAIQIALVDLLASWSIKPLRVTGHSSGEIAAAYCAGALKQPAAMAIAYHRGRISQNLKAKADGAMLAVELSECEAGCYIATLTQGCVKIACVNSPNNVTISGDRSAIVELSKILETQGISVRKLNVEVAYHSHHMQEVAEEYLAAISDVQVEEQCVAEFHSSVSGRRLSSMELGPEYWVSNLLSTVRFVGAMQSILFSKDDSIIISNVIEVGPHSALRGPLKQIFQDQRRSGVADYRYQPTLIRKRSAIDTCHELVVQLLASGYCVDLNAVNFPNGNSRCKVLVDLPPYTWNHSSLYWAENADNMNRTEQAYCRSDLLGIRAKDSVASEPRWRNIIRPSEMPWTLDHVVQSNTVYPAAGFLAMAIEAQQQHVSNRSACIKGFILREVTIGHALILSQDAGSVETMISLRPHSGSLRAPTGSWNEFCISSSTDGRSWTEHCRGLISVQEAIPESEVDDGREARQVSESNRQMVEAFDNECKHAISAGELYESLAGQGLTFGPTFSNLRAVRASSCRCIAEVAIPNTAAVMPAQFEYPYVIHPATLDSCIHSVFPIGARYNRAAQGTPVPTFIDEIFVSQNIEKAPGHILNVYAQNGQPEGDTAARSGQHGDALVVLDSSKTSDEPVITFKGLIFSYLTKDTLVETTSDGCGKYYQTHWQPDPSFLSSTQVIELSSAFRKSFRERDQACITQQAAFYYAELALATVGEREVMGMPIHHQKLYASMTSFCSRVRSGQLGMFLTEGWLHPDTEERAAVFARVAQAPYGLLLSPIGENLSRILRQEIDPLSIMVEADRLERYYRTYEPIEQCCQQAAVYVKLLGHKNPHMNILEIGAGTGGATLPILEVLRGAGKAPPNFAQYHFTDVSPAFFEKAKVKLGDWQDLLTFKKLDIEMNPVSQGYEAASYDLIIAANVVHATRRVNHTLKRIRSLLKPGGTFILLEITVQTLAASLVFGTLPGWWIAAEETRTEGPLLTVEQWDNALQLAGFTGANTVLWDMPDVASQHASTIISTRPPESRKRDLTVTIVTDSRDPEPCVVALESLLEEADISYTTASMLSCDPNKNRICIVLRELGRSVLRNPSPSEYEAVKHVFLESGGVLWVTEGALIESTNPDLNLVTGLARTIRVEKGDTVITTLDLEACTPVSATARASKIFAVLMKNFGTDSSTLTNVEYEFVERKGQILIPRILEDDQSETIIPWTTDSAASELQQYYKEDRPVKAVVQTPGLLDSIHFVPDDRIEGTLSEDWVEVQVKASGVNFRDVMTALGQISSYSLGCECSGVISAVGENVKGFRPGDHVIATVKDGSFCSSIRALPEELEIVPPEMPFEVAAALPVVYFTAYWAVFKAARLRKGETVLIHAASGGLGQALINLCQLIGTEILATVGTLEKKRLLMDKYNISESNIFSSRDTKFAKGIMRFTKGKGVDVIMNSLSGEALRETWNCIASFGRFIELGKRDFTINSRLEMRHFERNVSFIGLDVPLDSQQGEKRRIWGEIMAWYSTGSIKAPWPITLFGVSELEKALRTMQAGKHMGKLVLVPRPDEVVKIVAPSTHASLLRTDSSYLLIGGLGGIGRATALWMLKYGAKNFIFASPSGLDKQKSREVVTLLRDQGAHVSVFKCDISSTADLEHLLAVCRQDMPPIRGMIHGALVSKADLFGRMSLQDYNDVMKPKVDGIWNLHNQLSKTDLDFFIMLSSVVGVAGDPSQAAYVSASVFQDAFAEFRNGQGLPAVTLDLGKVIDIGIVAENFSSRRGVRGLWSRDLREDEVMANIESAIRTPLRRRGRGSTIIGLKDWSQAADPVFQAPLFSQFRRAALESSRTGGPNEGRVPKIRENLKRAASLEDAAQKTCDELVSKTASLLMIPKEDINPSKSMLDYGMDSLVAVELRNWLLRELEAALPVLELMTNTPLKQLSVNIVRKSKLVDPGLCTEKSV